MESAQFIISGLPRALCLTFDKHSVSGEDIFERLQDIEGIPIEEQRLVYQTKNVLLNTEFSGDNGLYFLSFSLKLSGGKGGFGALLRGQGAKLGAKKTTNFDDCRDLNGRRIRHVKNEEKLAQWMKEQANKPPEKKEEKNPQPKHEFNDAEFTKQLKEITSSVEASVEVGLKKFFEEKTKGGAEEENKKRKIIGDDLDLFDFDDQNGQITEGKGKELETVGEVSGSVAVVKPLNPANNTFSLATIVGPITKLPTGLDLAEYTSAQALEALGGDRLKNELQSIGLICGGTPLQRAERLFSLKGKTYAEIDQKLFAKNKKQKTKKEKPSN